MSRSKKVNILYRCYDERGTLLYIGQTADPTTRLRKHAERKDWRTEVHEIHLEHFRTGDALKVAEQNAIADEAPVFNVAHNPGRREALLDWYDDGDPEDPDSEYYDEGDMVLVEYDGPHVDATRPELLGGLV